MLNRVLTKAEMERDEPHKTAAWMIEGGNVPAVDPVNRFLESLSEGSRRTMRQALDRMAGLIAGADEPLDAVAFRWAKVEQSHALKLREDLAERFSAATANKMVSALRGVMRACRTMGLIDESHYQQVARLSMVKDFREKASRVLTCSEVAALFGACAQDSTPAGRRDAALLAIFLMAALRRTEAIELNLNDYDPRRRDLMVRSPIPERNRIVRFAMRCHEMMLGYLAVRGKDAGALLLPVDKGGTMRLRRLTDQAIYSIMQRMSERAKIKPVTTRDLRRTCVTHMIAAGMSLERVRMSVGHLSWLTTAAYQSFADDYRKTDGLQFDDLPYMSCH